VGHAQGQTEYYAAELLLNAKLRVFAVNCSSCTTTTTTTTTTVVVVVACVRGQLQSTLRRSQHSPRTAACQDKTRSKHRNLFI